MSSLLLALLSRHSHQHHDTASKGLEESISTKTQPRSTPGSVNAFFLFTSLPPSPPELRNKIYHLVLLPSHSPEIRIGPGPHHITKCRSGFLVSPPCSKLPKPVYPLPSLLLVCRQIYIESHLNLYSAPTFVFPRPTEEPKDGLVCGQ